MYAVRTRAISSASWVPYKPVPNKVKFYAALGNHDSTTRGSTRCHWARGFYTSGPSRHWFFASTVTTGSHALQGWRKSSRRALGLEVMYFHHPIYSSGGSHVSHGAARGDRTAFLKYGVDVVMAGQNTSTNA